MEANKCREYFEEVFEIQSEKNTSISLKYIQLRTLLEKITKELTQKEVIQFSNLFSRLSFVCDKYKTSTKIHGFRVTANNVLHDNFKPTDEQYNTHRMYFCDFIASICNISVPEELKITYPKTEYQIQRQISKNSRLDKLRVEIIEIKNNRIICNCETKQNDEKIVVAINEIDVNETFASVNDFWIGAQLYLVNIQIDENEIYHPKFIILEPDYLVDISAIAECFQDYGTSELNFVKSKFEKIPNTKHIRLGNFANLVVDELFSENQTNQITFNNTIKKDFQSYPFEYTTCIDLVTKEKFQQYLNDAEMHYNNIKRVIENEFKNLDINIDKASLEPDFLCELYGIKGRLDILENSKNQKTKIVELKSGGVPFPDDFVSIKPNHKTQLYLYYQLIGVLNHLGFGEVADKTDGYILYSKITANNIRYDKPNLKRVQEILNLRNKIIINEYLLTLDDISKTKDIIVNVIPENIILNQVNPNFRALLEPQIKEFLQPIITSEEIEKIYFYSFVSFIAKEQYLAKLGNGQYESNNGLANLWLMSFLEKTEKFEILFDLEIANNLVAENEKLITFKRTNTENQFVNFRVGDICILYPRINKDDKVTTHQIFKCTISKLSKNEVTVNFRYKQRNTKYFDDNKTWALERDFMDSSFTAMYRNIYSFLSAPINKKQLLLTIKEPIKGNNYGYVNKNLSEEQNIILNNALSAKDYFLLNGPPGTGKTSIVIKELVRELYNKNENTNILILAYTNRAVDELCDAVNNAIINFADKNDGIINFGRSDRNFIRIGSELSCKQEYKHNLLSNICQNVSSREELKALLGKHRVFISTVASIASKMDIFELKTFNVTIVDEASQILEPQIIGVLPKCEKFILIGDHKQLPAIVLQDVESSKSKNQALESIGLENRKNSLFERLYTFCENKKLEYAFGMLKYQGRMHKEIALFPNYSFYNSELKQAFEIENLNEKDKKELERQVLLLNLETQTKNTLEDLLSKKRLIFFQSKIDLKNHFGKVNEEEADLVVKIIDTVKKIYLHNGKPFNNEKTIGIIAPFRNQIALIKQKLEEAKIPEYDKITVDTVERYQGSQRDIIIFSFAINNPYQLNGIVNLNDDGSVDRKLNVALTRAKEQLILIGNDSILSNNLIYFKLIEFIKSKGGYIWDTIENIIADKLYFDYFDSDESITNKTYSPDDEFKMVFDELIIDILKNDKRTKNYPSLILGETNDFIRNNIIEYGRTNFDVEYKPNLFSQEFSISDKVNLYCFYNMRKHYFSSYSIYETYFDYFELEMKQTSGRIMFLDFGCGPMTSGIAFNQLFKEKIDNFSLRYYGIDISNGMIEKAKTFCQTKLFSNTTKFEFSNSIKGINNELLEENLRTSNTIILNFSYLFANLTTEQTIGIADDINYLIKKFPLNKYIIVYQNPVHRHHNFTKFKKELKDFANIIVHKSETVTYRNNSQQNLYDKTEHFTYEIISN